MKTPEQKAADEALEQAIRQCLEAYGVFEDSELVMTEFVCAVEGQSWDEDGNSITDVGLLFRGGQMKHSTAIGLVIQASDMLRHGEQSE
jgi:hypothetical protein